MIRWDDLTVGAALPVLTKPPLTTRQLVMYAGASGDFNAIHYDDPFARAAGYRSVIGHGMLSMAFLAQLLSDWAGPAAVAALSTRFQAVAYPGDVITVRGEVLEKDDAARRIVVRLQAANQEGTILSSGQATLRFAG